MDAQLEPIMSIDVPRTMSGDQIIDDLLDRIAARLVVTNSLRPVDCYRRYSARVVIDLQLDDIDSIEAHAEVRVGSIDPLRPSKHIALDAPGARADEVQERSALAHASLERPIDNTGAPPETAAPKEKRIYVSRARRPRK